MRIVLENDTSILAISRWVIFTFKLHSIVFHRIFWDRFCLKRRIFCYAAHSEMKQLIFQFSRSTSITNTSDFNFDLLYTKLLNKIKMINNFMYLSQIFWNPVYISVKYSFSEWIYIIKSILTVSAPEGDNSGANFVLK